jgi:hypothetical protein
VIMRSSLIAAILCSLALGAVAAWAENPPPPASNQPAATQPAANEPAAAPTAPMSAAEKAAIAKVCIDKANAKKLHGKKRKKFKSVCKKAHGNIE